MDSRNAAEDSGRKGSSGSSTTKVPASPVVSADRKKSATPSTVSDIIMAVRYAVADFKPFPLPFFQNSILSTGTGRSRNSPLNERATLAQGIQNGKDR